MGAASLLFGVLSIAGFVIVLIGDVEPVLLYWVSAVLALMAILLGVVGQRAKHGRTGMWLGLIGLVIGIAMALW